MLAMYYVLRRDGVVPAMIGPAVSVVRRADDPDGAIDFVDLIGILIAAAAARPELIRAT
jgi:hypothetical protein